MPEDAEDVLGRGRELETDDRAHEAWHVLLDRSRWKDGEHRDGEEHDRRARDPQHDDRSPLAHTKNTNVMTTKIGIRIEHDHSM
jgi:hypothetical protein